MAAVPALLARQLDLPALRYDYPLVLTRDSGSEPPLQPLTGIVDDLLRKVAPPGPEGERLRRHVLRLEQQIRARVAAGATGSLSELWRRGSEVLLAGEEVASRPALAESLECARRAITADGMVLDCTALAPAGVLTHLWRASEAVRRQRFFERIHRLVLRLRNLLKADFMESADSRTPGRLQRAFGPPYSNVFDFQALSRTLDDSVRSAPLPEHRRRRLRAALDVLESQRFVPVPVEGERLESHGFAFDSCRAALDAFASRLPEMAAVVKAMAIADLELDNRYRDAVHDPAFAAFGADRLTPADIAAFPTGFVALRDTTVAAERSAVLDALSAGLPLKILAQFDDILDDPPLAEAATAAGRARPQLGAMAIALNRAFVLQTTSAHLYRMRRHLQRGLAGEGAALFCVYSGSGPDMVLPPYLAAAAAVESRAFPLFVHDPAAGDDWASRFDVRDNPQPESAWPTYTFEYEGPDRERRSESCTFTYAAFAACDARFAACLQAPSSDATACVPLVDGEHVLHRFAVGDGIQQATRRCADAWRSLQELGGIANSHARRLLEQQRVLWEREQKAAPPVTLAPAAPAPATAPASPPVATAPATTLAEPAPASDDPYIETPRCTTCDECTRINDRMFVYNDNKQATIADPNAGTYRELVEAAESCQVSIVHPGKPRNPGEPDLEELVRRAAPFQ